MKKFLVSFVAAMLFILPNVAQADTLDDFKNILASKHFFIKYTYQRDYTADNTPRIGIEAYDGNNFYTEDATKPNEDSKDKKSKKIDAMMQRPAMCHLKIGDKLFMLMKTETKGKVQYNRNNKTAQYKEVDEEFDFLKTQKIKSSIGTHESYIYNTALSPAVIALFNEEDDIYSGKYLYRRAGSGTTADGLEYFDLKSVNSNENRLNAIRYYFENGVIKKIDVAVYGKNPQTGELSGNKIIIEVEEFNTNPDPKYFKLPDNFKKIEKAPEMWNANA